MSALAGGTEGPWTVNVHIWHGEDWYDPLAIVDVNGDPLDLGGAVLEWFARPSLNHATRFSLLATQSGDGIIIEDAANGLAAFWYDQADVEANFPVNVGNTHWEQFLRLTFTDPDLVVVKRILFTGALYVHPARDAATPP